ncbi:MAG: hypothetical protein Q4C01_07590 [Clostridia bacterium]|nr:hypothetical protein [Clostridia bacterium]
MKRTIAVFLTLMLVAIMLPASEVTATGFREPAEPIEIWDGTIATGYAGGSGTESDPYLIENGAQLAYLAQQVGAGENYSSGKYFKLTAHIYLNDPQIGKAMRPPHPQTNGRL